MTTSTSDGDDDTSGDKADHKEHTRKTALLVDQLHAIVEQLELLHPGRKFPLDGHLVRSLAETAA